MRYLIFIAILLLCGSVFGQGASPQLSPVTWAYNGTADSIVMNYHYSWNGLQVDSTLMDSIVNGTGRFSLWGTTGTRDTVSVDTDLRAQVLDLTHLAPGFSRCANCPAMTYQQT